MNNENRQLIWFTFLSYIDKGLAFVLPLSVLCFFKDKEVYNSLEYAYSLANIAVYLFSVGSMYSFYGYKISSDKDQFIRDYLAISCVSVMFVSFLTLIFALMRPAIGKEIGIVVYILLSARITLLLFINMFSSYYRLKDKPSTILLFTIATSTIIILLLPIFWYYNENLLYSFALPELIIPILICTLPLVCDKHITVSLKSYCNYYRQSIVFAWPIVLNCLLGLGITNFGKIYAFNYMTADDMYVFSYTMRISLVIGMAHTSIVAFYSKDIYTNHFTLNIGFKYVLFILSSAVISLALLLFLNNFLPQRLPVDLTMVIIFLYNILFYAGSFCEAFYGRQNKNTLILKYSIISGLGFVLLIFLITEKTIINICFSMLVYSLIRLFFMVYGLNIFKKIKIG